MVSLIFISINFDFNSNFNFSCKLNKPDGVWREDNTVTEYSQQ